MRNWFLGNYRVKSFCDSWLVFTCCEVIGRVRVQSFDDQREGTLGGGGAQHKLKMFLKDPKRWGQVSDGLVAHSCVRDILGVSPYICPVSLSSRKRKNF